MEISYGKPFCDLLALFEKAQREGDDGAQLRVAKMLLQIKKPNAEKAAAELLQKSAKRGNVDARFELGRCYETGVGVQKNARTAVKWYDLVEGAIFDWFYTHKDPAEDAVHDMIQRLDEDEAFAAAFDEMMESRQPPDSFIADFEAAACGDAEAQYRLADRYYCGKDIEVSKEEAVFWYTKSAKQGCERAIHALAMHYEKEKNFGEAAAWYGQYAKCRLNWFHAHLRGEVN